MSILIEVATAERCDESRGFLQSGFWGRFKAEFGWTPRHFSLGIEGREYPLLVLERNLGAGLGFAYVPHGPECELPEAARAATLAAIAGYLRPHLSRGSLFVRFDPPWYAVEPGGEGSTGTQPGREPIRPLVGGPLRRAAADVQPPDTVLLDLTKNEEELLSAMKPKWRYNIRLAEKKGVTVEEGGACKLGEFYRLYRETALRDRIALHPERYYARLFSLAQTDSSEPGGVSPELRLWLARHEGETLAAIVTLFRRGRAVYLYGASSDSKRNLMPAYALQWAAIRAARAAGCIEYDFFGIPPSDDPRHPMAGLYRFKTGFGGSVVHRAGSWDYPLRPLAYAAFRAAEAARTWWFKDLKKGLRPTTRTDGPAARGGAAGVGEGAGSDKAAG